MEHRQAAALFTDFQQPGGHCLSVAPSPEPFKPLGDRTVYGLGDRFAGDPRELLGPTVSLRAFYIHTGGIGGQVLQCYIGAGKRPSWPDLFG